MPIYGMFATPTLGMLGQESAFSSISQNLTNMNTGGYKAQATNFKTFLGTTFGSSRDNGGLVTATRNYINQQGVINSSINKLDLAIDGRGFYVMNTLTDGTGDTFFTRDGQFEQISGPQGIDENGNQFNEAYLADKNGNFLYGYVPAADGSINLNAAPVATRVDQTFFDTAEQAQAASTLNASIALNVPSTTVPGASHIANASVFDSAGNLEPFAIQLTRNANPQEFNLKIIPSNGTSTTSSDITFNGIGKLPRGTTENVTIVSNTGLTTTFELDLTNLSAIGEEFNFFNFDRDGRTKGFLNSFEFDASGRIRGNFSNGTQQTLYKLPIAVFANENGLDRIQGNLFQQSILSGIPQLKQVNDDSPNATAVNEFAIFRPFSQELSNTNVQFEFSNLMITQNAYNSSAMLFKTIDEMTQTVANLKT